MSETMVEKVARAIWEAECKPAGDDVQGWQRMVARAAIEAMREPTDQQRQAYYELSHKTEVMFDAHWERAVDAALHDPEGGELSPNPSVNP